MYFWIFCMSNKKSKMPAQANALFNAGSLQARQTQQLNIWRAVLGCGPFWRRHRSVGHAGLGRQGRRCQVQGPQTARMNTKHDERQDCIAPAERNTYQNHSKAGLHCQVSHTVLWCSMLHGHYCMILYFIIVSLHTNETRLVGVPDLVLLTFFRRPQMHSHSTKLPWTGPVHGFGLHGSCQPVVFKLALFMTQTPKV